LTFSGFRFAGKQMIINYNNKTLSVFSDTHGKHRKLPLIEVDIVIHLGDACNYGNDSQLRDFLEWFGNYPAKHKIFVAGNHELQWELEPLRFLEMFPKNIIFLENRVLILDGITFVSVPARMGLHQYPKLKLPEKTDFLLTHAPPKGILDNDSGCPILKRFVQKLKPEYHLFGHIHETEGQSIKEDQTKFINTSFLNH